MKIILSLLLAVITFNVKAQTYLADTSIWRGIIRPNGTYDTSYIIPNEAPKTDTVRAIFIVSDTTNGSVNLYMDKGYAIREFHSHWDMDCANCPDYWLTILYLNREKQPFKSRVIWQAKLITD